MRKIKLSLGLTTMVIVTVISIMLGELLIRFISPHPIMSPRREFSVEYGFLNYKDRETLHELPSKWRYEYTTNTHRNRGVAVPISNVYENPNIVVLGDSYTFGVGVNDGEEYAAVMAENLRGEYDVINLGVGGWGLAQQIRRYYEFGRLYAPKIVLLQYCKNDIDDNFNYKVTRIENDRFVFVDAEGSLGWIKKYFSDSFLQKSQIYALVRDSIFLSILKIRANTVTDAQNGQSDRGIATEREQFYMDLLSLFAKDLSQTGTHLVMLSVNGQLDESVAIRSKVAHLEAGGLLRYVEVADYFQGVGEFSSPEGHLWGQPAHRILGDNLAMYVRSINAARE